MRSSKGSFLPFLHIEWCHMATHHPLYFLYCEAQLGRQNGTDCVPVFVSLCTHVVPAGDSPGSLAAIQDLFSLSLYVTTNGITDALCPVLFLLPPPAPPSFVPLPPSVLPAPILHPAVCRRHDCASLSGATVSPMGTYVPGPHPKHLVVDHIPGDGTGRCVGC